MKNRLVYGSPLPPGTEAPTLGELRIRVEKMILREDAVNEAVRSECLLMKTRPAPASVDHCALSPLFPGEVRPTAQCTPTTPGKMRGVLTLVYPIKTYESLFIEYVTNASNPSAGGVQLLVVVPTSYSGRRRPVHIGQAVVALNSLKSSAPVGGWYTLSRQAADTNANADEKRYPLHTLVDVGKVKLVFTLIYFSRTSPLQQREGPVVSLLRPPLDAGAAGEGGQGAGGGQAGGGSEGEAAVGGRRPSSPCVVGVKVLLNTPEEQLIKQQCQEGSQGADKGKSPAEGRAAAADMLPAAARADQLCVRAPPRTVNETASRLTRNDAISRLLEQGYSLRNKMERALDPAAPLEGPIAALAPLATSPYNNRRQTVPCLLPMLSSGDSSLQNPLLTAMNESVSGCSSSYSGNASTRSTAQCSTESISRHDDAARPESKPVMSRRPVRQRTTCIETIPTEGKYVEVDLSHISFYSGRATLGMEEMRIGIHLSKDVKTDEPVESYSSYVHRVPLAKGPDHHIVIGFQVRAFSESRSRMVISFYRVSSAPVSNPSCQTLLPDSSNVQRVLVEETLLGMCIVGLHSQSRDIVLHNPLTGEDPTQAYLCVRLRLGATSATSKGCSDSGKCQAKRVDFARPPQCIEVFHEGNNSEEDKLKDPKIKKNKGDRRRQSISQMDTDVGDEPRAAFPSSPEVNTGGPKKNKLVVTNEDRVDEKPEAHPMRFQQVAPTEASTQTATNTSGKCDQTAPTAPAVCDPVTVGRPLDGSTSNRFRLHVVIRACKELPLVALRQDGLPMVPVAVPADQMENGVRSVVTADGSFLFIDSEHRTFTPPSTFFTVEDIYSSAGFTAASRGVVPDWYVESAVRGEYDRSHIVPWSQSPKYDYECVLSLPPEAVFLRQAEAEHRRSASQAAGLRKSDAVLQSSWTVDDQASERTCKKLPPCLCDMRLTLWHYASKQNSGVGPNHEIEDEELWANAAQLGECRVDLRALRFLKVIDGWYRIYGVDRVDDVVGYVRVSVRLL